MLLGDVSKSQSNSTFINDKFDESGTFVFARALVVGALVVCGGVGAGVVATRTAKVVPASLSAPPAMCDPRTAGDGCTSLCGIQADLKTGRPGSRGRYDVDRPWARQICGDPFISHRPQV